jgi:hypothetical protein
MLYLIMPDRFANGNPKTIAMLLQKKIQSRFTRRKTRRRHSRDNKNLDYISSLGATAIWSTPLCEDNDKAYPITPMLNLMFKIDPVTEQMLITCVWPLRCIKRHEISYGLCCNHWESNIGWWKIYQHKTGFINLKTIRKRIINALR